MTDPRLDRLVQFDPRSRAYPIRAAVPDDRTPRAYSWRGGQTARGRQPAIAPAVLDQGREGACVGFAWAHELNARPKVVAVDATLARDIYREAQTVDQWPGEDYEGTSVIAGAKVVQRRGYLAEYRWAFGLSDLLLAIGYIGPAVLGINWYTGMIEPDSDGTIRPTGRVEGGHAIEAFGVSVRLRRVALLNSWGTDWGRGGVCYLSWDDLERLLHEQGEACVPMIRQWGVASSVPGG